MNRQRNNTNRKDVTLMTVIAYDEDSNKAARALLKKYGKPDCKHPAQLELQLAQLYFDTPDKLALEKELAEIHPHKNWLLKRSAPPVVETVGPVIEEVKEKSGCKCGGDCPCKKSSSFDGTGAQPQPEKPQQSNSSDQYLGIIGLVAVVGIAFYALSKSTK